MEEEHEEETTPDPALARGKRSGLLQKLRDEALEEVRRKGYCRLEAKQLCTV